GKAEGDAARAAELLDAMEADNSAPELNWLIQVDRARHHALMGRPEAALNGFIKAFQGARYRSGPAAKEILNDLLIVAAFLNRDRPIAQWGAWAKALGLAPDLRNGTADYVARFPLEAHYPE